MFKSDLTRSQQLNLADCLQKIRAAVHNVKEQPKESPETPEKIRRRLVDGWEGEMFNCCCRLEKMARVRLAEKRERSLVKEGRRSPTIDDL